MPNWVFNYLSISGEPEVIAQVKEQLNKPFTKKHDQWNPETHQMEVKDYPYNNPVFAFHNIYNHTQDGVSDETYIQQPDYTLPIAEAMKFQGNHWYDWNVRNWGTKWDVAVQDEREYPETELTEETNNYLAYRFNTAWSPPHPIIQRLSFDYPTLDITLSYEEETGWGGETEYRAGVILEDSNYENKCRDCDEIDTLEYCDNECGEICDSCHYLGEADLEAVAECEVHKVFLTDEYVPEYRRDELNV